MRLGLWSCSIRKWQHSSSFTHEGAKSRKYGVCNVQKWYRDFGLTWHEILVCVFSLGLGLFHFFSNLRIESYAPDSSYYIGLADAILKKGSYEFNFAPHIVYPPGLPLALSFIALGFGSSYIVFVRAMAVIGALGLLASYALLRCLEGRTFAAVACLILGSSAFYFHATTQLVGSDVPYFFTSTLTLLFAIKLKTARFQWQRWGFSLGLVAFLIFSLLLRTVAVALLAGTGAWLISNVVFGRRDATLQARRFTPALLIGVLVLGIWLAWVEQSKHEAIDFSGEGGVGGSYVDQFWANDPHNPELGSASDHRFTCATRQEYFDSGSAPRRDLNA